MKIQLTKQQQQFAALGAIWLIGGSFVYIKYFWIPISTRISKTQQEIEDFEGKSQKAKGQANRLEKIRKEIDNLNAQAIEAEGRLPKTRDMPAVIDTLSALEKRYNIKVTSFAPGAPSDKQFFTEIPYTMAISAPYHDVGRFFAALALEQRIFNVRSVTFAPVGADVNVNFQLIAYQYKG